jgi:hypothetical protein
MNVSAFNNAFIRTSVFRYQPFTYKASLYILQNTFEHLRTEPYLPFINHLRNTQQHSLYILENTFEQLFKYSAVHFEIKKLSVYS